MTEKYKNYNVPINSSLRSSKKTAFGETLSGISDTVEFLSRNATLDLWHAMVVSGMEITQPMGPNPTPNLNVFNPPEIVTLGDNVKRYKIKISIVSNASAGPQMENPDAMGGNPLNISLTKMEADRIIARGSTLSAYTSNIIGPPPQYGQTILVRFIDGRYYIEQNSGGMGGMGFAMPGVDMANLQWNISSLADMPESCTVEQQTTFLNTVYAGQGYVGPANRRQETWRYYNSSPNTGVMDPKHPIWTGKPWLRTPLMKNYTITSPYGGERCKSKPRICRHGGVDFGTPVGTPCYAVFDGVVVASGWQNPADPKEGWGIRVSVKHSGGYTTIHAHLSQVIAQKGKEVKQGDLIGLCGNTGSSTGPHLHWEMRYKGKKVDPLKFPCSVTLGGEAANQLTSPPPSAPEEAWSWLKSKISGRS